MLQALGLPLSKKLLTHAHWTMKQKKMSKSVGNVADPFEAMEQYGVDAVRYYMARIGGRFRDDIGMNVIKVLLNRITVDFYIFSS
jgi:methionyl-tRNA synthetase